MPIPFRCAAVALATLVAATVQAQPATYKIAYIDPLNYLQIELIRRHRSRQAKGGGAMDEREQRVIHLTINGIAAGLRNSG